MGFIWKARKKFQNLDFRRHGRNRGRTAPYGDIDDLYPSGASDRPSRLRHYLGIFALFILVLGAASLGAVSLLIINGPAFGQEAAPIVSDQRVERTATRIEVDEEAGVIRFFVEGQQAAQLDAGGLHVRGDLSYRGILTDYGRPGFDARAGRKDGEHLPAGDNHAR